MAQPCKVFSYTNVGTEKGVLANIASAAQAGGWTVDKTPWTPTANCTCTVRAAGTGGSFFRCGSCRRTTTRSAFCWPCTAIRGSTLPRHGTRSRAGSPKGWRTAIARGRPGNPSAQDPGEIQHHVHGLVDPAAGREQIVLVCPTFVMTAMRVSTRFPTGPIRRIRAGCL